MNTTGKLQKKDPLKFKEKAIKLLFELYRRHLEAQGIDVYRRRCNVSILLDVSGKNSYRVICIETVP